MDQRGVTVINKPVLPLNGQTAGIGISLFLVTRHVRWKKSSTPSEPDNSWKTTERSLTEGNDGQDDGDCNGHPGHIQSLLAVTLGFMRLQAHTAFQKTCRQERRAQYPHSMWLRIRKQKLNSRLMLAAWLLFLDGGGRAHGDLYPQSQSGSSSGECGCPCSISWLPIYPSGRNLRGVLTEEHYISFHFTVTRLFRWGFQL